MRKALSLTTIFRQFLVGDESRGQNFSNMKYAQFFTVLRSAHT